MLKPTMSTQLDLTAEWYFAPGGSLTVALFNKRLKDVIIKQSYDYQIPDVNGTMQNFTVTGPVNGARGRATGVEIAYQQYFDKLPGWMSGFGVQGNFTFVDSSGGVNSATDPYTQTTVTGVEITSAHGQAMTSSTSAL